MKNVWITLLLLSSFLGLHAQADSLSFPASWTGDWVGELKIYAQGALRQTLPMELHIHPMDTSENYTFYLIYGEDKEAGLRPYELVTVNVEAGLYQIDEKNSIAMEAYLHGNKLVQRFAVSNNLLLSTVEKISDEEMIWEIFSGSQAPVSLSGDEEVEGEEIPEVQTFPVSVRQVAKLWRKP